MMMKRTMTLALLIALCLTFLGASAGTEGHLTGFLDCSSGSATGYFTYSNHFYRIEWTGINTSETSSVQLQRSISWNRLEAYTNGDSSSSIMLRSEAGSDANWTPGHITGLTPGQSSSGYTSFNKLATGAGNNSKKKVCTVTCVAALKPKWNWSNDNTSCTATFICSADPSLTATVNATVTSSSGNLAANVTFNGNNYSYVEPKTYTINYVLSGGTNAPSNPATYRDDESVTLADPTRTGYVFEGWYNNAGFSGTTVTGIPYDSSGNRTFYAKWRDEIDGLHYDAAVGGFVIDSVTTLNTLANYSQTNGCGGKVFKQTADIALSGNFKGIGCYDHKFGGTYDGGNHYITGLYRQSTGHYQGFFRMTSYATVENVRLVSPSIDVGTYEYVAGLIGSASNTTVRNCFVLDPTLKGKYQGAIISWKTDGTYTDCYYYTTNDSLKAVNRNGNSGPEPRLRKVELASDGLVISGDAVKLFYGGAYYVTDDSPITLTVTPDTGYELSELAVKQGTAELELVETENANEFTFQMPSIGDVTAEATFAPIEYTITYDYSLNGVTAANPASYTVNSADITLVNPSRAGYVFTGWTGSNGATPQKTVTIPHGSTGDKTFTANWMEDHWGIVAGNDGSAENPYTVSDADGLRYLATYVNAGNTVSGLHFVQTADIALSGAFTPIGGQGGYNAPEFAGIYDGRGHTITGLAVNASSPYAGLFGYIQNGTVKNVTVIAPNVKASWSNTRYAGGIVGCVKPGYIENCTVINPTLSATYCGAICGGICARSTSISGCLFYASGNVPGVGMNNLQVPITVTRVNTLTLGEDITAEATSAFRCGGTSYYTEGTPVILEHTERDGYSFSYVAKGADNSSVTVADDQFTFPAKDVTVTAAYTPIVYDIAYNGLEGATFETAHDSYTIESETITLDRPTKTGYTFGGWYRNADLTGDAVAAIPTGSWGNVELWAKWTANTYTIHFEPNSDRVFYEDDDGNPLMPDQIFHYDQAATALTANAFHMTTGEWLGWNTRPDGEGTAYADGEQLHNLTAEDGTVITLYAQWRQMHRFNYNSSIFRCKNLTQTAYHPDTPEVYWAYEGDTVEVLINDFGNEYTVSYTAADGTPVLFDDTTSTFTMPNQEVWITVSDSLKKIDYTRIYLDDFDYWDDVAYLYDPDHPTVTPAVTVTELDGETVLTEGVDYTYSIINNTGSPSEMVTATVTVTGMGDYIGVAKTEFRITPFDIAECEIGGKLETYDDGYGPSNVLDRNVQILHGQTPLMYEADYIIELDNNIGVYDYEVGETYTATVIGRGEWGGQTTFTFLMTELAHTVVYDAGDAGEDSGTMPDDTAIRGQRFYLPECGFTAPRGMTFDHWEVDYEGIEENPIKNPGDYFTAPYIYDEDGVQTITVTAFWADKDPYTLTAPGLEHGSLLLNGEAAEMIDDAIDVYGGDRITIAANEGYTLALDDISVTYDENGTTQNVSVSADQTTPNTFTFIVPEADVIVAAEFVEIPKYTVSFAPNGGGDSMASETVQLGNDFTLPECGFTAPADKQFLEWSVQVGAAEAVCMDPGDAFTVTADTTVTPVWTTLYSITVNISRQNAHGTLVPSKAQAIAGEVITLTATPEEGYALSRAANRLYAAFELPNGATDSLNGFDREDLTFTMPDGNVTVYAAFISPWEQLQGALSAGGTVTLDRNYAATATDYALGIPEGTTVTLDLNGFTLDASASDSGVLNVFGALTLTDGKGGGTITGGHSRSGAGVAVCSSATFTMNGGKISGNTAEDMGGGVAVNQSATFTMNGGEISGNTATTGGGVFNMGSFAMTGGRITGNTATTGGGVAAYSDITLSGEARIDGNSSDDVALVNVEQDGTVLAESKIAVGGALTGAAQHPINVRYIVSGSEPDAMVFTDGLSGNGGIGCFNSVDTVYRVLRLNGDGEAELCKSVDILALDEGGYPVYDAWMMVLDADENVGVVDQWASGENTHSWSGFTAGATYTLRAQAPVGYETPADIAFSVDSTGKLTVNGSTVESGRLVMPMHIASYALTVPEVIDGGEMTVTVNGQPATEAHLDDVVCVTYIPAENFELFTCGAVREDGSGIYVDWSDDYLSFSFRMPDQSVTLPVSFRRLMINADFTLPASIQTIEDNAFEGGNMTAVYIPDTCTTIGAEAFKNCTSLTQIRLPQNCQISSTAFDGCDTIYVFAPAGGDTQSWCEGRTGIVFIPETQD